MFFDYSKVEDLDLTSDEEWEPVWNPYQGKITPRWQVIQDARYRMPED